MASKKNVKVSSGNISDLPKGVSGVGGTKGGDNLAKPVYHSSKTHVDPNMTKLMKKAGC